MRSTTWIIIVLVAIPKPFSQSQSAFPCDYVNGASCEQPPLWTTAGGGVRVNTLLGAKAFFSCFTVILVRFPHAFAPNRMSTRTPPPAVVPIAGTPFLPPNAGSATRSSNTANSSPKTERSKTPIENAQKGRGPENRVRPYIIQ